MNEQTLKATAAALTADGKGLLAMDESNPTADRRFAALGIPQTPEMRRAYRDMIVTAPGLSDSIGGAILYDETIRTRTFADVPFAQAATNSALRQFVHLARAVFRWPCELGRWAWRLPPRRMATRSPSTQPCAMIAPLNFERLQCNSE